MAKYRIPDRYLKGFKLIGQLDEQTIRLFSKLISTSDFGIDASRLADSLSNEESLKHFEKSDLEDIIYTLFSILRIDEDSELDDEKFLHDLSEAAVKQLEGDNVSTDKLFQNLKSLSQNSGKTKITIKAKSLLHENERNYSDSRLITDIRFVFDEKLENEQPLNHAIVVHKLKISFYNALREKDQIFFSMDSNDLFDLKKHIDRAILKEQLLRNNIDTSGIKFLTLDGDN